jgi:hypothetical protein
MTVIKRLEALLAAAESVPVKDGAGIITAAGIDAAVRVKAITECLKIVCEEEQRAAD